MVSIHPLWKYETLENVIECFIDYRGKTPTKTNHGVKLITAKNVKKGFLSSEPQEFISVEDYPAWMVRGKPEKGDVLFTTEAPLAQVAQLDDENVALAQRIITLRGKKNVLENSYLKWSFMSEFVQDQIWKRATGSTVKGIRQKELRLVKIPLPPLPEQQRIVARLDKAQQLIDQRKEQLALMDDLIQSLFYEIFGDPVKNEKGWEVNFLGAVVSKLTDGTHKTPVYLSKGVVFISAKNVKKGYLTFSETKFISTKEHSELTKRCKPESGDIVITKSGSIGMAALVDVDFEFSLFESLALVKYDRSILNGLYLKYHLNDVSVAKQYANSSKGGTIKHLHLNELRKVRLLVPPLPLQQAFADRVQQIEALKQTMTASLKEMEQNFQALMQEAFGG